VQQNASLVEEASAAAESMKDQASVLLQAVSRFRVGDTIPARIDPVPLTRIAPIKVRPKTRAAALPRAF
jgi:hypothetical protein